MTPQDLLANFETLAEAPNGIQRLRELVLELAVRGKLVAQDPSEESVEHALRNHIAEFELLLSSGRGRKGADSPDGPQPEFTIPSGWAVVPFGGLAALIRGITFPSSAKNTSPDEGLIPCLRTANIQQEIEWDDLLYIPSDYLGDSSQVLRVGDVVISMANSRELVGKVALHREDHPNASFGGFLGVIRSGSLVSPAFVMCLFRSASIKEQLTEGANQTTNIANISFSKIRKLKVALPSIAEQRRIVARVDELMALLDHLEAKRREREAARTSARDSALAALREAPTSEDVETAWLRIQDRFHELFVTPEDIGRVRQTISELAIRGMLVPQRPDEGDASLALLTLLENSSKRKNRGRLREGCEAEPIAVDEAPFHIPVGWTWVRLNLLGETFDYGTSEKAHPEPVGTPVLRMNNIQQGEVRLDNLKYIEDRNGDLQALLLGNGDLLFNRTNSYELVGKSGVYFGENDRYTFASYLIRIRLIMDFVMPEFASLYLNSPICRHTQIEPHITQQTGQANFNGTKLKGILFPLPTITEQKRIMEQVRALNALVSNLAAAIDTRLGLVSSLAAAAIHHLEV